MFNVEQFKSAALKEPVSTQIEACPEGEFLFMIDSDPKQLTLAESETSPIGIRELKGVSQKSGKPYHFWQLGLMAVCMDEGVKQQLGRDNVRVRLRINLDLDDQGNLDFSKGRNVALGRLLEALDLNKPGVTLDRILGAGPFVGRVEHTTNSKTGDVYADIVRVAKVS